MKKGVKKPVLFTVLILVVVVLVVAGIAIKNGKMQPLTAEAEPVAETVAAVEKKSVNVAVKILEPEDVEAQDSVTVVWELVE